MCAITTSLLQSFPCPLFDDMFLLSDLAPVDRADALFTRPPSLCLQAESEGSKKVPFRRLAALQTRGEWTLGGLGAAASGERVCPVFLGSDCVTPHVSTTFFCGVTMLGSESGISSTHALPPSPRHRRPPAALGLQMPGYSLALASVMASMFAPDPADVRA